MSVVSGLTSEAYSIQEQDLSGFEPASTTRKPKEASRAASKLEPMRSSAQNAVATSSPKAVISEEDKQRDLLFAAKKPTPTKASTPGPAPAQKAQVPLQTAPPEPAVRQPAPAASPVAVVRALDVEKATLLVHATLEFIAMVHRPAHAMSQGSLAVFICHGRVVMLTA